MTGRVAIIGIGYEGFRPCVADLSTREMMFEASSKAYDDAGVDPRKDISSFISCDEDLWEGWSITDEMVPDQIGGAKKPVCTVPGDGLLGIGHGVMQVMAGVGDVVAVESHFKASDVLDKGEVERMGIEPTYLRPLGVSNDLLAGLEMDLFLRGSSFTRSDCSEVSAASKQRALKNPRASYSASINAGDVEEAREVSSPLRTLDKAQFADCAVTVVLASDTWARKRRLEPVYIDGVAWSSSTPWYERGGADASYAEQTIRDVFKRSGLPRDASGLDFMEVDDTYSYKLLQHLIAISGSSRRAKELLPLLGKRVNPSGGSLGVGYFAEATGLHRLLEAVLQLRGQAGPLQVRGAKKCLVFSWRGHPTATGAAVILSR
jgi:acetyl-CoA C-acetyltransferase